MKKNEMILCVRPSELPESWTKNRIAIHITEEILSSTIKKWSWQPRLSAEKDRSFKQIIPYAVLQDRKNRVGCYRRSGSEQRLHGLWSLGVGGHINPSDSFEVNGQQDIVAIIRKALLREIDEEFIRFQENCCIEMAGVIHENETDVGHVHLGVVFTCTVDEPAFLIPAEELSDFTWHTKRELHSIKLELWSQLAFSLIS